MSTGDGKACEHAIEGDAPLLRLNVGKHIGELVGTRNRPGLECQKQTQLVETGTISDFAWLLAWTS